MARRPTVPPIQFTKDELRVIDDSLTPLFQQWYNGDRSQTRILRASNIRGKIRAVLGWPAAAAPTPGNEETPQ